MNSVTVIIVTYNSASVIGRCLDALVDVAATQVVIVDNDSSDASVAICRAHPTDPTVVVSADNPGFARSVNRAAEHAEGEYLLLLNPDAVVDGPTIRGLAQALDGDADIGVVGPRVRERSSDVAIPAGLRPSVPRMFLHLSGFSRLGNRLPLLRGHYLLAEQAAGQVDVDWVTGACLMTRTKLWKDLSGLTTRWFMYAEDIEYCLRVRELGYRVVLAADLYAHHAAGMSSGDLDQRVRTEWIENLYDLYQSHYDAPLVSRIAWRLQAYVGFTARALVAKSPYDKQRFRAYARAMNPLTGFYSGRKNSANAASGAIPDAANRPYSNKDGSDAEG